MSKYGEHATIWTTTKYDPDSEADKVRIKLAKRTLLGAVDAGLAVCCVDAGSPDEFLSYLSSNGVSVFPEADDVRSLGGARRQALMEAVKARRQVNIWTEPEKDPLVSGGQEI